MRSPMTRWLHPCRGLRPSTVITEPPAPRTSAPQAHRKSCKSTISGSRAALVMTVTPSAPQAASMAFSVAPTLGMASTICPPVRCLL